VRIDYRWGASNYDPDRMRKDAAELLALAPDVVLATTAPIVVALQQVSRTVPIVFATVIDPVGAGVVASLARPGGNATGFITFEYGISAKWLELLKEISPGVKRVAVLREPTVAGIGQFAGVQTAAPSFGVELQPIGVSDAGEIERALADFARATNAGLIVPLSTSSIAHRERIVALAARHRLPAIYPSRLDTAVGGLWPRFPRPVPPRGRLRRSHPQGRETRRSASAGADQVRAGDQSQDRQGSRPHRAR
jgi:putative tryptophan/tyrosine transport system substrate-binding protein